MSGKFSDGGRVNFEYVSSEEFGTVWSAKRGFFYLGIGYVPDR